MRPHTALPHPICPAVAQPLRAPLILTCSGVLLLLCSYGAKCQFAHGSHELRARTRTHKYKTQRCKNFWQTGSCPYGARCNFLHLESSTGNIIVPLSGGVAGVPAAFAEDEGAGDDEDGVWAQVAVAALDGAGSAGTNGLATAMQTLQISGSSSRSLPVESGAAETSPQAVRQVAGQGSSRSLLSQHSHGSARSLGSDGGALARATGVVSPASFAGTEGRMSSYPDDMSTMSPGRASAAASTERMSTSSRSLLSAATGSDRSLLSVYPQAGGQAMAGRPSSFGMAAHSSQVPTLSPAPATWQGSHEVQYAYHMDQFNGGMVPAHMNPTSMMYPYPGAMPWPQQVDAGSEAAAAAAWYSAQEAHARAGMAAQAQQMYFPPASFAPGDGSVGSHSMAEPAMVPYAMPPGVAAAGPYSARRSTMSQLFAPQSTQQQAVRPVLPEEASLADAMPGDSRAASLRQRLMDGARRLFSPGDAMPPPPPPPPGAAMGPPRMPPGARGFIAAPPGSLAATAPMPYGTAPPAMPLSGAPVMPGASAAAAASSNKRRTTIKARGGAASSEEDLLAANIMNMGEAVAQMGIQPQIAVHTA